MQYAAFPIPDNHPDYLSHELISKYLDDFVDHFGFRARIQFRTKVTKAVPAAGGGWDVTVRQRDTGTMRTEWYGAVLVANGHHRDPQYPEPAFPGAGTFTGEQIHSHDYRTPEPLARKRILVLGTGNFACDVAADCSQVAARTLLAVRRGTHIVPKYLFGRPGAGSNRRPSAFQDYGSPCRTGHGGLFACSATCGTRRWTPVYLDV